MTARSSTLPPPPIPSVTFTSSDASVPQYDRFSQVKRALPEPPDMQKPDDEFAETNELLNTADANVQKYTGRRSVNYLNKAGRSIKLTFRGPSTNNSDSGLQEPCSTQSKRMFPRSRA